MPLVKCACGCGDEFEQIDRYGRIRHFCIGHNRRLKFKTIAESFWSKVIKTESGCWKWSGAKSTNGYGSFTFRLKRYTAHTVSYEIAYGKIPKGMCIRHSCDNPECSNPKHLELGTHTDNMHDMIRRGRSFNSKAMLSNQDVRLIRHFAMNGISQKSIAKIFDTAQSHVSRIVNQEVRKNVTSF